MEQSKEPLIPANNAQQIMVTVPPGSVGGSTLPVKLNSGQVVNVTIPQNCVAGQQFPIMIGTQPVPVTQMSRMQPVMGLPVGPASQHAWGLVGAQLDALHGAAGVCIRQKVRWGQLLTGGLYQQKNRMKIMIKPDYLDSNAPLPDDIAKNLPPIFWAVEESGTCMRQCCRNKRSFRLDILNSTGKPVLHLDRPFKCDCVCNGICICKNQELTVRLPGNNGATVGRVVQQIKCCSFHHYFDILDENDKKIYEIKIPICECWAAPRPGICCQVWQAQVFQADEFAVNTKLGPIAHIQNVFAGCNCRGLFSKADNFQVNFHAELSGQHKFLILSALFLLDMVFFEVPDKREREVGQMEEQGVSALIGGLVG